MATINVDAPFGLRPVRDASGRPFSGACNEYYVSSTQTGAIFVNSPIYITGSADSEGRPTVAHAAASTGNLITGVVIGVRSATDANEFLTYRPSATAAYLSVVDDPDVMYEIKTDAEMLNTYVGSNANFVNTGGSTITGYSNVELASTTVGTGATKQLKIVGVPIRVDTVLGNASTSESFVSVYVKINLPGLANGTVGV